MGESLFGDVEEQPAGITRRRVAGLLAGAAALGGGLVWGEADAKGKKGKKKRKKKKVNPFKDIAVNGDAVDGETFAGKVTIASFRYDGAQILAAGTLTGTVTRAGGATESVAAQSVEFPYSGAGPARQRNVDAQSGASGSLFLSVGFITLLLLQTTFTLNGFALTSPIGKNKARVAAVNEIMSATDPQAITAGLNKLRATFPA